MRRGVTTTNQADTSLVNSDNISGAIGDPLLDVVDKRDFAVSNTTLSRSTENSHTRSFSSCKHCGVELQSYQVDFCCPGCRGIYGLISELGLDKVYTIPGNLPSGSFEPSRIHYEALRKLDESQSFDNSVVCETSCNPFEVVTLHVEGITCNACVWLLEGLSTKVRGLFSVRVNPSRGQVKLVLDRQAVLPSDVALLIERLGYRVVVGGNDEPTPKHLGSDLLIRVALSGYCSMNIMLFSLACYGGYFDGIESSFNDIFRWLSFLLALPVVGYCAKPIWSRAFNALKMGIMHLDIPICLGTGLTFIVSTINLIRGNEEIYFDSISGLIFLLLSGRWLQGRMLHNTTQGSNRLGALLGGYARVILPQGDSSDMLAVDANRFTVSIVPIGEVKKADLLLIESGERSCVDGVSEVDHAEVDRSFLTGESRPVLLGVGDRVFAGDLSLGRALRVRADGEANSSSLARLLSGMPSSVDGKGAGECLGLKKSNVLGAEIAQSTGRGLSDTVAPYFTWGILSLSVVSFFIWLPHGVYQALNTMVSLLIVACPCAFGVALPAIEAISSARALKLGILVKRVETLERLSKLKTIVFDKTGTLTVNRPHVVDAMILSSHVFNNELETISKVNLTDASAHMKDILDVVEVSCKVTPWHPISKALVEYLNLFGGDQSSGNDREDLSLSVKLATFNAGAGIRLVNDGREWLVGSVGWTMPYFINGQHHGEFKGPVSELPESDIRLKVSNFLERYKASPIVAVTEDGVPRALFAFSQEPRRGISAALRYLKDSGFKLYLLSGDRPESVQGFVKSVGVLFESALSEQSPQQKLDFVRHHSCVMVGDGINDAAALGEADVGIAVSGGIGTVFRSGDIYLLNPDGGTLKTLFNGAVRVSRAVRLCFLLSLAYNLVGVSLAISGVLSPLIAALMMPVSSLSMLLIALVYPSFKADRGGVN